MGPRTPFDLVGVMRKVIPGQDALKVLSKSIRVMDDDYERGKNHLIL